MTFDRRTVLKLLAGAAPAATAVRRTAALAQEPKPEIAPGPFSATRDSLKEYRIPDWFRDAKFGIWAHWGPQSAAEYGDWYARNMYIEGHKQYQHHLATYGHPSKFGFKDVIPTWKAEKFDPDYLVGLYRKAGAKYFVSMGVHHDNFDLWNSKHHRWNAVNMGPRKDVVGLFGAAARKHGLRFGVSEHLAVSYHWFQTSHGADSAGPYQGVPYDGADPQYAEYYHETHAAPKSPWDPAGVPLAWKQTYLKRIQDLVDNYQPDLLYTDGPIFFEEWGLALVAHHYNRGAARHNGKPDVVYTSKRQEDCAVGTCVLDLERGIVDKIWPDPWQTDTCIGHWHYDKEATYKSPKLIVDMLVDIVSRNGNLLLNFPLPNNGMLDSEEMRVLEAITAWMAVNSEGIYATRPWKIYGQGTAAEVTGAGFNERNRKLLTAGDVRFTTRGKLLYAFLMGWPEKAASIPALGTASEQKPGRIRHVHLLGSQAKLQWKQEEAGLTVAMPAMRPCDHAVTLKIEGAI